MRKSSTTVQDPGSMTPADPAEVAIANVGWRRIGLLRRLVKMKRRAATAG
jgi:hypothetical protein